MVRSVLTAAGLAGLTAFGFFHAVPPAWTCETSVGESFETALCVRGRSDDSRKPATLTIRHSDGRRQQWVIPELDSVRPPDIVDIDFDGRADVMVTTAVGGSGGGDACAGWIYKPDKQLFQAVDTPACSIDDEARMLFAEFGSVETRTTDWYRWKEGQLIHVRRER